VDGIAQIAASAEADVRVIGTDETTSCTGFCPVHKERTGHEHLPRMNANFRALLGIRPCPMEPDRGVHMVEHAPRRLALRTPVIMGHASLNPVGYQGLDFDSTSGACSISEWHPAEAGTGERPSDVCPALPRHLAAVAVCALTRSARPPSALLLPHPRSGTLLNTTGLLPSLRCAREAHVRVFVTGLDPFPPVMQRARGKDPTVYAEQVEGKVSAPRQP